jgi:hypothetical protein
MKFTIRRFFFTILFLGIFLMTLRPIADPDFWWHLRTGELILQTHTIPHTDPFSYTKSGSPWVTHEWLSESIMFGLFQFGEYGLLIAIFSAIITGAFLISYFRCPVETRPYVSGFVVFLCAISSAPTWGVRPQMISLLLTSLFLYLLDGYRRYGSIKYLLPLPLITLIWVNFHAGYLLGLALIGIYILGGLAEVLLIRLRKKVITNNPPTLRFLFIESAFLGGCLLSALVNPNGIKIILYPFQTLTSPSMQKYIQEWFSPDFHQFMWQPFAWLILALIGFGMINTKPLSPTHILVTLILGYAALRSMRNIPLFAVSIVPVLSEQVGSQVIIPYVRESASRLLRLMIPLLLLSMAFAISLRFIQVIQEQSKTESYNFPQAAVNWLIENHPQGNIYNSYGWGGYLIWRLYPKYLVNIDGRADIYGDKFLLNYLSIYHAEQGWEDKLNSQGVQTVIIESNAPLANSLRQSPLWQIAFEDKLSIIFIRRSVVIREVLPDKARYLLNNPKGFLPPQEPQRYVRLASHFRTPLQYDHLNQLRMLSA